MNSDQIQERLWHRYYGTDEFSDVTSSHWKRYGEKTKVLKTEQSYKLQGYGFGNRQRRNVLNIIRNIPTRLMFSKILRDNNANHKTINTVNKLLKHWNIIFGFSHLKNLLSYDLINSYGLFNQPGYICIIGDGYGFLGTLIKNLLPKAKIIFVNLGRQLLFDIYYFSKIFPEIDLLLLEKYEDQNTVMDHSIIFLEAEQYELLNKLPISLFINIASMQEMDMSVIQKYFEYMRTSTVESYFYCCNREEKTYPDGNVIRFLDYPWNEDERIIIHEPCTWYQKLPVNRPPFWIDFDGVHLHRLIQLNTQGGNGFS